MADKKRIIEGYEETNCIRLGGKEIILAENKIVDEPYLICDCTWSNPFNVDEFSNGIVSDDYLEIMSEFANRISERCRTLEAERAENGISLEKLTAADCIPQSMDMDLEGQVVVIKPEKLAPEYRSIAHQLNYCTGGNGARPDAIGRAVFCENLCDGKSARFERQDIAGIISTDRLPEWAREKLAALQKPAEKESVIDKIRHSKTETSPSKPKSAQKKRSKDEAEH